MTRIKQINTVDSSEYVNTELVREHYEETSLLEKVKQLAYTIFNSLSFYMAMLYEYFSVPHESICKLEDKDMQDLTWAKDNEGLIVIVHGLLGDPRFGCAIYGKTIKEEHPEYEVKIPYVSKTGNCSLEEAATPITIMVEHYVTNNPGKPVQLIGFSNGGRIVGHIATQLSHLDVHIRITGIAGVFFGSDTITTLKNIGLAEKILDQTVIEEMTPGSKTATNLIDQMRKSVTLGSRSYHFYATVNDHVFVPNASHCLPNIEGATHTLISGQDHVSIGGAVMKEEVDLVYQWMHVKKRPPIIC